MKLMNEKIILGIVGLLVVLTAYSLGSGYAGAQIVGVGTNNTSIYLFENLNVTVVVNNTAQYDLFTQVECNFFDPENNLISVRSACNLVEKRGKKDFLVRILLNKPGDWKLQSCVAYSSLQAECKDAIPQHTYKYDPYLTVKTNPRPNSIQIVNPSERQILSGIQEITAVPAGNYQKLEFGFSSGDCSSVNNKRELDFSYIPVIYNWNTTGIEDGNYNICLFLSGFGFNSTASRNITIDNYNFTLNPSVVFNQSVVAGVTVNYTFNLKNKGVSDTFTLVKNINPTSGQWNSRMIINDVERTSITLGTNEEASIVISIDVPFVNIGVNALVNLSAKNSKNENIYVQQFLNVSDRVKRGPIISNIAYSDHIEQGLETQFVTSIRDPDGDDITRSSVCYNENCSSKLCDLSYEATSDLYKCNSVNLSSLATGTYDLFFTATDSTGVRTVVKNSITIDVPVHIDILLPYLNERVSGNTTVKADVYMRGSVVALLGIGTDAGCTGVSFRAMTRDQLTNGSFVSIFNTESVNDGKYFVCVKAVSGTEERFASRVVYVDNYNFEINPIYQNADIVPGANIDLDYVLANTGRKVVFDVLGELNSSDFQIVGFIVGGRLIDRQTRFELNRGESVNISVKVVAKTDIGKTGIFSLKITSNREELKSRAVLSIASITNNPPVAESLIGTNPIDSGSSLSVLLRDIKDKENDLISKKNVCNDEQCNTVLCSLQFNSNNDNKYSCQYVVNSESGSYFYYVVIKDDKGHETIYMKQYFVRNVQQPVCGGTFSGGYFECVDYSACNDKDFPPPCYKKQALGTDGCLRGKVCCKSEQKGCTSSQGCSVKIVSKSCIYDQGTDRLNVYSGIDWYGGGTSDVFVGTKKSNFYTPYSYVDQQTIDQDGVIRILANVYGVDGSLYCSNETYVYCYRSVNPIPLTGVSFIYPVQGTTINSIVPLQVGLNGLGSVSFAYSLRDRQCSGETFQPMFCVGNICKINFDSTKIDDGTYYLCAKAEGERILTNYTTINVQNYDFSVSPLVSTANVISSDISEYPVIIKNTGGVTDTFTITSSIDKWNVSVSKAGVTLSPGQSEEVKIILRVPDVSDDQKSTVTLRIAGSKKTITTKNDFIVKRERNYPPSIKFVGVIVSPVEVGNFTTFSALISDPEGDNVTSRVCKDSNCTNVYCNMNANGESYNCSYDTTDMVPGTYSFYVEAKDYTKTAVTSAYTFNIKANDPLLIPVYLTLRDPPSNSIIKGQRSVEVNANGTNDVLFAYSKTSRNCQGSSWSQMSCISGVCTTSFDTTQLDDGDYYICAKYKSVIATNYPVTIKNYNFRVDPLFSNNSLKAGASNQLIYSIKNTGYIVDSYNVTASIDKSWIVSVNPNQVALQDDRTVNVIINLDIPAGVINQSTRLSVVVKSFKTGRTSTSASNLTVTERSNTAPMVTNITAIPGTVDINSTIKFTANISDIENDIIQEKKICLDEFCELTLCSDMTREGNNFVCNYVVGLTPRTYEYFVIARDSTGQLSKFAGSFTVRAKQISQVQQSNTTNIVSIPKPSPRNNEKLTVSNISVSSVDGSNIEDNMIDGSQSSYWSTKQLPATLILDLGSLKDINGIGIYSTFGKPVNYDIELSQDCTSFFAMQSVTNAAYTDDWNLVSFKKTAAKCVRITISKTDGNAASISEFHVYASRAVASEEEKPAPTQGFDYTLFVVIGIAGAAGVLLFIFREPLVDRVRETIFKLKYGD
ncbi:MAG: discoidin domain-containing protein [Candidatus Aenigmarchaeota archaeon]|nr:discoidin domain-containing protein [Candidatus Aenigmarchaeota archaeon]